MHWYDNWFWSLAANGRFAPGVRQYLMRQAVTPHRRALIGWIVVNMRLTSTLEAIDAPILDYENLAGDGWGEMLPNLAALPAGINTLCLASRVIATRNKPPQHSAERVREWEDAYRFADRFVDKFAPAQLEFIQPL